MTTIPGMVAMRDVRGLLATHEGQSLLRDAGVFTNQAAFLAALRPPLRRSCLLGPQPYMVYMHQQPSPDFRTLVLKKFVALAELERAWPEVLAGIYIAIDTDRAASSKAATCLGWHDATGRRHTLKVTPPRSEALEFRHFSTDPRQLDRVVATLEAYLRQSSTGRNSRLGRLQSLRPHVAPAGPVSYGRYAASLGEVLLGWHLGLQPRRVFVSCLCETGEFRGALTALLAGLDDYIRSFNRSIARCHSLGVATADVHTLPEDYLPLFYSCPVDGHRVRLRRRRNGGEILAVAETRAGRRYSFSLGRDGHTTETLFASRRWSPDVLLPTVVNGLFSGIVAGLNSALYLMIQNTAIQEALGVRPLPVLVPKSLAEQDQGPPGLLQRWLMGADTQDGSVGD
jgi:hypothetical protein